jgi:ADP-dependent NAD(P)H-hydrate dehydratase / NAD(P)H-hydrate epimerase
MKLLTADEMRSLDREAIEKYGVPGLTLMENAGRGAGEYFSRFFERLRPGPVLIFCGKGNNGGDGYVIARHMENRGWQARLLVLAKREDIAGDARVNLDILHNSGADIVYAPDQESLEAVLPSQCGFRLIVDAIFGNGLASEIRGHFAEAVDWINASGLPVAAVDMPSGVNADTGAVLGRCVQAACSATFAFPKVGQMIHPAASYGGEIRTVDIGMPKMLLESVADRHVFVDVNEVRPLLPERRETGHKGTFGHLLIVAGSTGKTGAAALAAEGGMRAGAGLVTLACPLAVHDILETKLTEAMTVPLPDMDGALSLMAFEQILALAEAKQVLAVGPGLGTSEETRVLVRRLVRACPVPMVIDADGLNALAENTQVLLERREQPVVLTPHPGEMARLTGKDVAEIQADRIGAARDFAKRFNVVLVLKGARTLTAFPDGRIRINGSGNPGLASGGMGDVLTGLIGGFIAQGLGAEDAAVLGVFLHGMAADRLAVVLGHAGMVASDILPEIPVTLHSLRQKEEHRD